MMLQSKTANCWMATEIDRRYGPQGLHATAVHPGMTAETTLQRHFTADEFELLMGPITRWA